MKLVARNNTSYSKHQFSWCYSLIEQINKEIVKNKAEIRVVIDYPIKHLYYMDLALVNDLVYLYNSCFYNLCFNLLQVMFLLTDGTVRPVGDHLIGTKNKILERQVTQFFLSCFKSVVCYEHNGCILPKYVKNCLVSFNYYQNKICSILQLQRN